MRVTVVRPADLGPGEAELWAGFQRSCPHAQDPFLSLTFARAVGRHRDRARVAVVEADGAIIAFLAFELTPARIGMPIGYPMNNLQAFVSGGVAFSAKQVIRKAGLRGWRFVAAPADHSPLAPYHYEGTTARVPLIDLSEGYKAYYLSRSKKFIEDAGRHLRSLERRAGPVSLEWGSQDPAHVRKLIEWKSARYGGARELFADPAARGIAEEVSAASSADCAGLVNVLRAGDRTVALLSALAGPAGLSGWFTAYDAEMRKFSPGTMALLATAQEAEQRGITRIDMGAGQDSYKFRMANGSYLAAGGAIWTIPAERAGRAAFRRLYAAFSGRIAARSAGASSAGG